MIISQLRHCLIAILFAALAGPSFAQSLVTGSYDEGMRAFDAGDYAKALEHWGPLAEGGDAVAQYSLGKLLENGGGRVEKDPVEAAKWYERSANQGVSAAQNNLGLMYAQGRGVPRDTERAAHLWLSAAEKDHVIAQFNLGLAYYRGEGVAENKNVAVRWFRRSGELGLADAQYALGQVIRLGLIEAEKGEALSWYQLAAAQGHVKAKAQAEELRKAGVKPKALTLKTTTAAAKAPSPPAKPVAKQKQVPAKQTARAQPAPEASSAAGSKPSPKATAPMSKPAPEPQPAPAQTQAAAVRAPPEPPAPESVAPQSAARGPYRVWLISLKDEAEAGRYLQAARTKHPAIFAEARGAVARADLGKGGVFHRVVAGGLPNRQAARDLCRRLRAEDPEAFCKILAN
jgi:TPR repeat protein